MAITQQTVDNLEVTLNSGDRGGFYLQLAEVYKAEGASQAAIDQIIVQSQITTGSGLWGGAAALGNAYAQENGGVDYDVTLDTFSRQIGERFLEGIESSIASGQSGVFNASEIRTLDYSVWRDKGMGDLFPGQADRYLNNDADNIPSNSVVRDIVPEIDLEVSLTAQLTSLDIGALALWNAGDVGKRFSDYGFNDAISVTDIPSGGKLSDDGKYIIDWDSDKEVYTVKNANTNFTALIIDPDTDGIIHNMREQYKAASTAANPSGAVLEFFTGDAAFNTSSSFVLPNGERVYLDGNTRITPEQRDALLNRLGFDLSEDGIRRSGIEKIYLGMPEGDHSGTLEVRYEQLGNVWSVDEHGKTLIGSSSSGNANDIYDNLDADYDKSLITTFKDALGNTISFVADTVEIIVDGIIYSAKAVLNVTVAAAEALGNFITEKVGLDVSWFSGDGNVQNVFANWLGQNLADLTANNISPEEALIDFAEYLGKQYISAEFVKPASKAIAEATIQEILQNQWGVDEVLAADITNGFADSLAQMAVQFIDTQGWDSTQYAKAGLTVVSGVIATEVAKHYFPKYEYNVITGEKVAVGTTAGGAGAIAAVVSVASTLIQDHDLDSGQWVMLGVNAGVAAAAAITGASIASAFTAAGSLAGPIGTVVGAVVGLVLGNVVSSIYWGKNLQPGESQNPAELADTLYQIITDENGDYVLVATNPEGSTLIPEEGITIARGGSGNDNVADEHDEDNRYFGGGSGDLIDGQGGNDTLIGDYGSNPDAPADEGADTIYGGSGNDIIQGDGGNDSLHGDAGDDTVTGGTGEDIIFGGTGNDIINGEADNDTIEGGLGDDVIGGGEGNDIVVTGDGSNTATGDEGNDTVIGGYNNDTLTGWSGEDAINGLFGDDSISGGDGADHLSGDVGRDSIAGDQGDDTIDGGDDIDVLQGGSGSDIILGGNASDFLNGDIGDDMLLGEGGDDELYGGLDDDLLKGLEDNDYLEGNQGDDILDGGEGNDNLNGGEGDDIYVYYLGSENDTITDESGNDKLVINGYETSDLDLTRDNDDLVISVENEGEIRIQNHYTTGAIERLELDNNIYIDLNNLNSDLANNPFSNGSGGLSGNNTAYQTYLNTQDYYKERVEGASSNTNFGIYSDLVTAEYERISEDPIYNAAHIDWFKAYRGSFLGKKTGAYIAYRIVRDKTFEGSEQDDEFFGGYWAESIDGGEGNDNLNGGGGDDYIHGGTGSDNLEGGEGNDFLDGQEGNDTLAGGDGADLLIGGGNSDLIEGGAQNDTIFGHGWNIPADVTVGNNTIFGQSGDDSIFGGTLHDVIDGGTGDDWVSAEDGDDYVAGGEGEDVLLGDRGDDTLDGGDGNDSLYASFGDDSVLGGLGDDFILGDSGNDTLKGQEGHDRLFGHTGDDSIEGGSGDDVISGDDGNDFINSGSGDDFVYADGFTLADGSNSSQGHDTVYAGLGNDYIWVGALDDYVDGGDGNDVIFGEDGNDELIGNFGNDSIHAGAGNDSLYGGEGADTLLGYDGDDYLEGDIGDDELYGLTGNDTVHGGDGNDSIYADSGDDSVQGEDGNDFLDGWYGNDGLYGGIGDDKIIGGDNDDILLGGDGNDIIFGDREPNPDALPNNESDILNLITNDAGYKNWGLLYQGGDYQKSALIAAPHDMIIINSAKDSISNEPQSEIPWTSAEIADIQSSGKTVFGYINAAKINSFISDWDANWTSNGLADGALTSEAPDWLYESESYTTYKVNFWDTSWQELVFDRIEDMINQGFDGTLIDDVLEYFVRQTVNDNNIDTSGGQDAPRSVQENAQDMRDFIIDIRAHADAAVQARDGYLNNSNSFQLVINGAAFILPDATDGTADPVAVLATQESQDYLAAIDGIILENYISREESDDIFGAVDNYYSNQGLPVLTLDTDQVSEQQRLEIYTDSLNRGYLPYATENTRYDTLNDTFIEEILASTPVDGDDTIAGGEGADTLTGGNGIDHFVFRDIAESYYDASASIIEYDSITDFTLGTDKIDIGGLGFNTLTSNATTNSGELRLRYDAAENTTYIENDQNEFVIAVSGADYSSSFSDSDFIFDLINVLIQGDSSANYIVGSSGYDTLQGEDGHDTLQGEGGDDILHGGMGGDRIVAGSGDDTVYGDVTYDLTIGNSDTIYGQDGNDIIFAARGYDYIDGGDGDDSVNAGDGNDTIVGRDGDDTLHGGEGYDVIYGGNDDDIIFGDNGSDTLRGDSGSDTIYGGDFHDNIYSGIGDDLIYGGNHNDFLVAEEGNDIVFGDDGNDKLYGQEGNDTLYGGDGYDQLNGGDGFDSLSGGLGNDTLNGDLGNDIIYGNDGYDNLYGMEGDDSLYGGDGNDRLYAGSGVDTLIGGLGADSLIAEVGIDTLVINNVSHSLYNSTVNSYDKIYGFDVTEDIIDLRGTGIHSLTNDSSTETGEIRLLLSSNSGLTYVKSDQMDLFFAFADGDFSLSLENDNFIFDTPPAADIEGTEGDDTLSSGVNSEYIRGLGGNDSITGWIGNDTLEGNSGDDTLRGDQDNDLLYGNEDNDLITAYDGNDTLYGGSGNDYLDGENDNDLLYGESGFDTLYGHAGNDTLFGNEEADYLYGGANSDSLTGGSGNDSLYGGAGDDNIIGEADNDYLYGGDDDDTLNGGSGNDNLYGDSGSDILTGGDGADYFIFDEFSDSLIDSSSDVITDFENNIDTIQLHNLGFTTSSIANGELVISYDVGTDITTVRNDASGFGFMVEGNYETDLADDFVF